MDGETALRAPSPPSPRTSALHALVLGLAAALPSATAVAFVVALTALAGGCVGEIRETTTARTSTEQLLISTAAERAVARLEGFEKHLKGRRVAVDATYFESYDQKYVLSALRHWVSERGAFLVPLVPEAVPGGKEGEKTPPPDRVLEVRSGALGVNDDSFGIGVPAFPLPVPQSTIVTTTPPLYLVHRDKQRGWAKLQVWLWDSRTRVHLARSGDLWGHAYHTQWWFFFIGPFDFSNDIYPEDEEIEAAPDA